MRWLRIPNAQPVVRSILDYRSALHRLLTLTDLERMVRHPSPPVRYDLGRMRRFLNRLGNPHLRVPTIHIAGTKGKGSTSTMVTSVLQAAGYSVGLYTSPHLHSFRERIRLGLEPLTEEEFARLVEELWPAVEEAVVGRPGERVTTFEMLTGMAFACFAHRSVDFQVLEVGLGGRLDATNVVECPLVCVITSLSLDHQAVLGETLDRIAFEKAGIIKSGASVVTAPQPHEAMAVIAGCCQELGVPPVQVGEEYLWQRISWDLEGQQFRIKSPAGTYPLWMPLLGEHQLENAACALATVEALRRRGVQVPDEAVTEGFRRVRWPGRLEVLARSPLTVVDGAHNPYSIGRLREALRGYFQFRGLVLLFGAMEDKNLAGMIEELVSMKPKVVVTRTRHPRSASPALLSGLWAQRGIQAQEAPDVASGLRRAQEVAEAEDLVLGTGSLFLTAEVREAVKGIAPELYPEFQRPVSLPFPSI